MSIIHRDLKPENILIESKDNLEIRIADFGFSCIFDRTEGLDLKLGSPHYMAPEIINHQNYNEKVDIWAIGVITFVLLTGNIPFPGKTNLEIKKMILKGKINFKHPALKNADSKAIDFMKKAMTID